MGITTTGTISTTKPVSVGLVTTSMALAPRKSSRLRSAEDACWPIIVCSRVVSVVMRDSSSPTLLISKKAGLSPTRRRKTAHLMSATTRSPSQETR